MANTHSLDLESSSSQYAYTADTAALSPTGSITVEAWIKFESLPSSGSEMFIASKYRDNNSQTSWTFALQNNSGTYRFRALTTTTGANYEAVTVNWTPVVGRWYHVAMVFNSSVPNMEFFVNGVSVGTAAKSQSSIFDSTTAFQIGVINVGGSPSQFFDGLIQNVRFWSDARTVTEIRDNIFADLTPGSDNLIDVWKLANNYNSETGNHNLTASGSPTFSTDVPFPEYRELNPVKLGSSGLAADANLISYYELEDETDTEGGTSLTNNNTVTFAAAKFNNGADFGSSNTNKYLSLASNYSIAGNGDISVPLWLRVQTEPGSDVVVPIFIHRSTTTADRYLSFYYYNNSGTRQLIIDNSNGFAGAAKYNINLGTSVIHHLVVRRISGTATVYLNGILILSVSQGSNTAGTNDFRLANLGGGDYGSVIIDDTAVFNDGLTASEIFDIYTGIPITSSIKKLSGVAQASLKKVSGVAIASVKKVSGVE